MSNYIETPKQVNSDGVIINPATEETLQAIKSRTDQLSFDGDLLKVESNATPEQFFARILNQQFHDDEQVKRDAPTVSYQNAFEYLGLALATANDNDAVWAVVRKEYGSTGELVALRVRLNIEWAQRTVGW